LSPAMSNRTPIAQKIKYFPINGQLTGFLVTTASANIQPSGSISMVATTLMR
jgi:hypothetical protein